MREEENLYFRINREENIMERELSAHITRNWSTAAFTTFYRSNSIEKNALNGPLNRLDFSEAERTQIYKDFIEIDWHIKASECVGEPNLYDEWVWLRYAIEFHKTSKNVYFSERITITHLKSFMLEAYKLIKQKDLKQALGLINSLRRGELRLSRDLHNVYIPSMLYQITFEDLISEGISFDNGLMFHKSYGFIGVTYFWPQHTAQAKRLWTAALVEHPLLSEEDKETLKHILIKIDRNDKINNILEGELSPECDVYKAIVHYCNPDVRADTTATYLFYTLEELETVLRILRSIPLDSEELLGIPKYCKSDFPSFKARRATAHGQPYRPTTVEGYMNNISLPRTIEILTDLYDSWYEATLTDDYIYFTQELTKKDSDATNMLEVMNSTALSLPSITRFLNIKVTSSYHFKDILFRLDVMPYYRMVTEEATAEMVDEYLELNKRNPTTIKSKGIDNGRAYLDLLDSLQEVIDRRKSYKIEDEYTLSDNKEGWDDYEVRETTQSYCYPRKYYTTDGSTLQYVCRGDGEDTRTPDETAEQRTNQTSNPAHRERGKCSVSGSNWVSSYNSEDSGGAQIKPKRYHIYPSSYADRYYRALYGVRCYSVPV